MSFLGTATQPSPLPAPVALGSNRKNEIKPKDLIWHSPAIEINHHNGFIHWLRKKSTGKIPLNFFIFIFFIIFLRGTAQLAALCSSAETKARTAVPCSSRLFSGVTEEGHGSI